MENENLDLDVKPAGNKDLWLFLIVVDIVLLCVFGFFLYRHFSTTLFHPETETVQPVMETEVATSLQTQEELRVPEEALPQPEQVVVVAQPEETLVAEVLAAQAKATEKKEEPATKNPAPSTENKQSIFVEVNPKSKYRKVTFRWYGEGENVAVVSGFTMSKPKALTKKQNYWEITLSIAPGTYKFLYVVDGRNRRDPYVPEQDGRSVLVVE